MEKTVPTAGITAGVRWSFRCRSNPEAKVRVVFSRRSNVPGFSSSSSVAMPAAIAMGYPANVLLWKNSPRAGSARSRISARPRNAPQGRPPPMILPRHVRSGVTRYACWAEPAHRLLPGRRMAHEELVDPAVVVALELCNHRTLAVRPRQPDRVDRRLGPGHREAHLAVRSENPEEPLRVRRLEFVRCTEHRGAGGLEGVANGLHHPRVAMAQDERTEGQAVVDVLVAVEVPKAAALRLLHRDRVGIEVFHAGRDAAWQGATSPVRISARRFRFGRKVRAGVGLRHVQRLFWARPI